MNFEDGELLLIFVNLMDGYLSQNPEDFEKEIAKLNQEIDEVLKSEGFEVVEDGEEPAVEEQPEPVSNAQEQEKYVYLMPRDLKPSREAWEEMGVVFEDIVGIDGSLLDNVLYKATLPEGWSIKSTDQDYFYQVLDETGLIRGIIFYKNEFYERKGYANIEPRYGVHTHFSEYDQVQEIYFGNNLETLFVAGTVDFRDADTIEKVREKYEEHFNLTKLATQYGDENYPGWRDINAYRQKNPTLEQKKPEDTNE